MKRVLLIASLVCWMGPAFSQTIYSGPGANSCTLFMDLYRVDPEIHETLFFAWAKGFMSGMNAVALRVEGKIIDLRPIGYDDAQQKRFLRSYCNEYPLRPYLLGVFALMTELRNASDN